MYGHYPTRFFRTHKPSDTDVKVFVLLKRFMQVVVGVAIDRSDRDQAAGIDRSSQIAASEVSDILPPYDDNEEHPHGAYDDRWYATPA